MSWKDKIRTIPDFPKKGIMFRDITTLLADGPGMQAMAQDFQRLLIEKKVQFDLVAGVEARGFIIGTILAMQFGKGLVTVRKKGKLPGKTVRRSYSLEYGVDELEIHHDAIPVGSRVLIVDDLMATGGTALCAVELVEALQGKVVGIACVIDLPELHGSEKVEAKGYKVFKLMDFAGH